TAPAIARSLVLREDQWEAEFAGTRAQLIAAGLARPGDFPGDPECPCKVRRSFERDDRHFQVRVRSFTAEPRSFVLRRSITNAERIKLDAERRSELEANDPNFRNDASIARELEEREARIRAAIKAGEYLPLSCREPHVWLTAWVGTREELTAAGICDARHFPQGRKRVARGDADDESAAQRRPGVKSWQTRALGRDYFEHIVWWNKEAQLARIRDGIGRKPIERPSYYADIDAFAKGCEQSVMLASRLIETILSGEDEASMYGECTIRYD